MHLSFQDVCLFTALLNYPHHQDSTVFTDLQFKLCNALPTLNLLEMIENYIQFSNLLWSQASGISFTIQNKTKQNKKHISKVKQPFPRAPCLYMSMTNFFCPCKLILQKYLPFQSITSLCGRTKCNNLYHLSKMGWYNLVRM